MRRPSSDELLGLERHQRAIYDQARHKTRYPVGGVLTTPAALWSAYLDLRRAAGRRTPGVDGFVYDDLEVQLDAIGRSIHDRTYYPAPLRSVSVPKASGGTRRLGIPTISDRLVQRLLLLFIVPVAERVLPLTSFACRPGFGAADALKALEMDLLRDGEDIYVVRADIKDFFDNIRHRELRAMLRQHLHGGRFYHVIERQLSAWRTARGRGLPQGAPASPVLANFYLWEVDRTFTFKLPDGVVYIRYMDDIALVVRGGRAKAEQVLEQLREELRAIGLRLNDKSLIAPADRGIDFLGVHFRRVGDKVDVCASDQSLARLKSRIDQSVVGVDQSPPGKTNLRGDAPDVGQTKVRKETIRKETRPERGLEETRPEQIDIEETISRKETPELDSAVIGFANYYTPHDHRVWHEICWYYYQRTGRWLDHGSGRDRPTRKGVPGWMLRLPGGRYSIDREEGVVGDTWLRPASVAPCSLVGLAANPEGPPHEEGTTFLGLMGLRDEPGDDEAQGLPDLDLGDSMRKAAGARRWLGAELGKTQQAISESRTRRRAMRATAARTFESEGYIERRLVDTALDHSAAYRERLVEEHRLALLVQRLSGEISRAAIVIARLQTEMDRRRQGLNPPSKVYRGIYAEGSGASPAHVDEEGAPRDLGTPVANLNVTLTNLALALSDGELPGQRTVTAGNPHLGMSPALSRQSGASWRGWSSQQIADYLTWLASGQFLLTLRPNGGTTEQALSSEQPALVSHELPRWVCADES